MEVVHRMMAGTDERRPQRAGHDARPKLALAVLTCMDARLDPARLLDLGSGDAHVLRNAGGIVTADVLESLALSQVRLGTRKIAVVHHLQCAGLAARMPRQSVEASVRGAVRLLRAAPELPHREAVHGFVLDTETGTLAEVDAKRARPASAPSRAPSTHGPPLSRCLWCRRAFDPRASSRRRGRRRYCGDLCRLAARRGGPPPP